MSYRRFPLPSFSRLAAYLAGGVLGAGLMVGTAGLTGCSESPAYEGPILSAFEQQQQARCVSLLQSAWHGSPVKSTAAERGAHGLDYVWVNVAVDDDHDDIARRSAKGATHGGHCQFDKANGVVHVHSYALNGETMASTTVGLPDYRYFTASADAPAVAINESVHDR